MKECVEKLLSEMTLEEKASFVSGKNFWETKDLPRLNLKGKMMTDGPHGLRKQSGDADHLGINNSEPATSFPTASLSACSFDPELIYEMGEALGDKCIRENVGVILGPGMNMKRSPLCGRNFEYFSEDPYLTGKIASAYVKGVQSKGIGTSLKHFAANNQEYARMVNDSVVDDFTLREIYLSAFEKVVKDAKPWTVMCSYNKINGTYSSENKWLLEDVLRKEWGFDGVVVTDWGALNDPVKGIKAGVDLEMPCSGKENAEKILQAIDAGELSEEELDACVLRLLKLYERMDGVKKSTRTEEEDHALARRIASESMVLLKNDGLLPFAEEEEVLIIGGMAQSPRYQGAGSSKINPSKLENIIEVASNEEKKIKYVKGYPTETGESAEELLTEAVKAARDAEKVILVAGLPDEYESEGFDRTSLAMPDEHLALIEAVAKVNANVAVVLQCGAPVELPWKEKVKAILLAYLSGQAGAGATVDILWGKVNPSGKLAETWPCSLEDVPSYNYFPGSLKKVEYREGPFLGYRYYNAANVPVNYPFGYGLSYTQFAYRNLSVKEIADNRFSVSVEVKNEGNRFGKEIVQIYVGKKDSDILYPAECLKEFLKVSLEPGEEKKVEMVLSKEAFQVYDVFHKAYICEAGEYEIKVGKSSRDFALQASVMLSAEGDAAQMSKWSASLSGLLSKSRPVEVSDEMFQSLLQHQIPSGKLNRKGEYTTSSCLEEIKDTLIGKIMLKKIRESAGDIAKDNAGDAMMENAEQMVLTMPLRALTMTGAMTHRQIEGIVDMANGHFLRGILQL